MSDTNNRPNADGSLRGDDKDLPNRGTGTGVADTYGASVEGSATNGKGRLKGTGSDAPEDDRADDPLHPDADD